MLTYQLTQAQYAAIYGCTARTVSRYQQEDAPMDEPGEMIAWMTGRKNTPRAFQAKAVETILTDYERATVDGEEYAELVRAEISGVLDRLHCERMIITCKLLAADQRGNALAGHDAVKRALGKITDQVQAIRGALGIPDPEEAADEREEMLATAA